MGKGISDNIGHPSSVADGKVKLGNEGQLALLAARLGNGGAGKARNKRLVISEQSERTALKKVTVVEERGIDSLELTIKSGVAMLSRGEFGREKGERLPGPLDLMLEDSTDVGIRGIGGEGDRGQKKRKGKNVSTKTDRTIEDSPSGERSTISGAEERAGRWRL